MSRTRKCECGHTWNEHDALTDGFGRTLITCMHIGNLPEEVAAQNNELVGTKVIPKLRDIWSEYEDRWTPKVSQERVAARFAASPTA